MATTVARLQAVLMANTHDFDRGMTKSQARMEKAGAVAKVAGVAIAAGIGYGMVKSVQAASDLHEQMTKTDQIFGKNARDVHRWAGQLAHDFGLSDRAALEYAGTYGNMLKPMGIAPKLVKTMSERLTELGGDMASFNNADISETLLAIQSGLAGQVRPLRRFGVFLDQDRIKAEALSEGLVKSSVSMADVHKAQVAIDKDHAALTAAQKKYGKGSLEVREATAKLEYDTQKLHKALAGQVPKLTAAQKAQASYGIIMKDTADTQGDFARTSGGAANQQRILQAEMENLEAQIGQKLLPVWVALLRFVTEKFMPAMQSAVEWFNKHWPEIRERIVEGWHQIQPTLKAFMDLAVSVVQAIRKHWATIGPIVMDVVRIVRSQLQIVTGVIRFFAAVLKGDWSGAWNALKSVVTGVFGTLKAIIVAWKDTALALMKGVGTAIIHGLEAGIDELWQGLKKKVTGLFHSVIGWVKDALGIRSPSTVFHGIGRNMIQGMINGVGSMKGLLRQAVVKIARGAYHKVTSFAHGPGAGDVGGLIPRVLHAVQFARNHGWLGTVTSGYRTYQEQAALYDRYLHGGPLAAAPGTSSHERGEAVDVTDPAGFARAMAKLPTWARLFNYLGARDPVHFSVSGYDKGGWLNPGWTMAYNGTGQPERVVGPQDTLRRGVVNFHFHGPVLGKEQQIVQLFRNAVRTYERNNGRTAFGF